MDNKKSWYKSLAGSIFFHIMLFCMVGFLAVSAASKMPDKDEIIDIVYDADAGGGGGGGNSQIEQEVQQLIKQEEVKVQAKQDAEAIVNKQEIDKLKDQQPTDTNTNKQPETNTDTNSGTGGGEGTGTGTGTGSGEGSGTGSGSGDGVGSGTGSGTGSGSGDGSNKATVPPRLISKTTPHYSEEAKNKGWEGSVTVSIVVDANGNVSSASVSSSSGHPILDQAAVDCVYSWEFIPAKNAKGGSVACRTSQRVDFYFK